MVKSKNCIISLTCSRPISALPDIDWLLSLDGLIYSVLLLTIHAVAAVWLPNIDVIRDKLWNISGPLRKMKRGLLFCALAVGPC